MRSEAGRCRLSLSSLEAESAMESLRMRRGKEEEGGREGGGREREKSGEKRKGSRDMQCFCFLLDVVTQEEGKTGWPKEAKIQENEGRTQVG